jgi:hypothetical protein
MALLISDTFTEASDTALASHTPDTNVPGNPWVEDAGSWTVSGTNDWLNASGTTPGGEGWLCSIDSGAADVEIQATIRVVTGFTAPGIRFRITDASNYLTLRINTGTGLELVKREGGSNTVLQTYTFTPGGATDYVVKVVADGSSIKGYLDGTERVSQTSTFSQTATKHGFRGQSTSHRYDNFTVNSLVNLLTIDDINLAENGHDVFIDFDTVAASVGGSGGFAVEEETAEDTWTERTIASYRWDGAKRLRLRLANGHTVMAGNALRLSYDSGTGTIEDSNENALGDVTEETITNGSAQTDDSITVDDITWTWNSGLALSDRSIWADGSWDVKVAPDSVSPAPAGSGSSFRNGTVINPVAGAEVSQGFDGRSGFDSGLSASYPLSGLSDGDAIVAAKSIGEEVSWASTTAYTLGQYVSVTSPYTRQLVCVQAGTSGGSTPTWPNGGTVTDGTVIWQDFTDTWLDQQAILRFSSTGASQDHLPPVFSGSDRSSLALSALTWPSLALVGLPTVATALAAVSRPWIETRTDWSGKFTRAFRNMRNYGRDISYLGSGPAALVAMSNAAYTDEVRIQVAQRGRECKGMADSGGHWVADGGHPGGRLAMFLTAAGVSDQIEEYATTLQGAASGRGIFGELDQTLYVDAGKIASGNYGSTAGHEFPGPVRGTWLHVPEWVSSGPATDGGGHPGWSTVEGGNQYRKCCSAAAWWAVPVIAWYYDMRGMGGGMDALLDYMDRYYYVATERAASLTLSASQLAAYEDFVLDIDTYRPALTIASAGLNSGRDTLTVTFNRWATGSDSGLLAGLSLSTGTLSDPVNTAPGVFEFTVTGAGTGTVTLDYDDGAGDVVDAGNVAMGEIVGMEVAEGTVRTRTNMSGGLAANLTGGFQ